MSEPEVLYAAALVDGLGEALEKDERVHLIGQYFLGLTSHRTLMAQLRNRFASRVYDPPIAENGYVGLAIGAALSGLRPIVDLATASFIFQAFSQIANEAANAHYMTGGQARIPAIFHLNHGIRIGGAAQHSHSPQAMLWNTPGLQIMIPSSPTDVRGLLRTALKLENPTMWIDHVRLFDTTGPGIEDGKAIPFGQASVRRPGGDVTIVATSLMVHRALEAADILADKGVSAEVVDPRTLVPLDESTILESVRKTGHLVVADECHLSCGVAAEIAARVAEAGFDLLRGPIRRVATPDVPIPFSRPLEEHIEPTTSKIVAACLQALGEGRRSEVMQ